MLTRVLLSVISICCCCELALCSCPQFGSDLNPDDYSPFDSLFLNINSPSQCHGNVTQWEFCYSRSGLSSRTHEVQFMVYRQNGKMLTYDRVSNSHLGFRRSGLPQSGCTFIALNQSEIFEIQPNDIIAVCMRDDGNTDPLRVTNRFPENELQVLGIDNDCRDNQLQTLDFGILSTDRQNVILVQAIINNTVGYRIGHNPAASSVSMSRMGLFINTEFPAQINGSITSWNYCYYTASLSPSRNYSALFALWRNNSQSSNLTIVSGSSVTVTLQPQFTIATIHCQVVELEPENIFIIMTGDYVGVTLPQNNPIPIIGNLDDHALLSYPHHDTEMPSLPIDSFIQSNGAIHLYADIDAAQVPTVDMDSSTSNVSLDDTTSLSEESSLVSGGVIATIVVVGVMIVLATSFIGAVSTLFVIRLKNKTKSEPDVAIQQSTVKETNNYSNCEDPDLHLQMYRTTSNVAYHTKLGKDGVETQQNVAYHTKLGKDGVETQQNVAYHAKLGKDGVETKENIAYQDHLRNKSSETDSYDYIKQHPSNSAKQAPNTTGREYEEREVSLKNIGNIPEEMTMSSCAAYGERNASIKSKQNQEEICNDYEMVQ